MKRSITFILLMLICFCGYAQSIDPALEKEMGLRKNDEKIRVFVIMKQQYDREQLCRRADYYTTRAERREFVVNELKQFADVSQYDIRQSLIEMENNDMVTEPKTLWIANAIYFSANKQAIFDLAKRKDVDIIGFDEKSDPIDDTSESVFLSRDITPNITQVNADQVWNLGYSGQGVVVAVVDTGVNYDHFDLKNHLWDGGTEFPNHGWDLGSDDNDPMDTHGHGTHCSGTVCGDGGGGRQTGIAPDVTLMCVKAYADNTGSGNVSIMCACFQWAVEHGADLISCSNGWKNASTATYELWRNTCVSVLDAGVVASISAGNNGNSLNNYPVPNNIGVPGGCPPPYMDPIQHANPGGLSCSVCVGAVDYNDVAADFTSHGPIKWSHTCYGDYPYAAGNSTQFGLIRPDVCAPGVNVVSADYSNTSGYCIKSGTSMAAPCVAGCMALMLSKNPELTPADICRILEETAVPLAEGKSNVYGYGRVDVLAAVNAVPDNVLSLASYAIHDEQGNNNHQLNSGESVTMDMNLHCGPNALNNATLNITCGSEYVTITNGNIALPNFAVGQTQTVTGFAFSVDESAPVRRKMTFFADVLVNGFSVGHFAFTLAVKGKTLIYEGASIVNDDNGNGLLEPGEAASLRIFINNTGNVTAPSVTGDLSTTSEYLTINGADVSFGNVAVYEQAYADFSVTLSTNATNAFPIPCTLNLVDAENQTSELEFSLYNITTTANPQGAGALTGAGTYGTGTKVTLSTVPDNNHTLISWKKGNTVLSYYNDCDIVVSENANCVANFNALGNVVSVGQAISQSNVSPTNSYYNYSLTQQIFTTEDLGESFEISSIAFFNAGTVKTRNCRIYLKHTEKSAFQDGQDWEVVAPEDLLFEGSITFTVGTWTTIYFDRAFAYDGIHNVVLVVDDNTGSYSQGLACRAFYPDDAHAIYIYSDGTNYNPYNPSGYAGTALARKNQVLFGIASYDYTVMVTAEPSDGGMVSVSDGPFFNGQPCTATATPSGDNVFYYWSENGTRVSTDATYNFRVMASRNLVAHFGPPVNVTVSAEPEEGGTVSGGGTLGIGQPLTLTATANEGYVFDKWTLNNSLVAYTSTYNLYVPGEAEYVAHFEPLANGTMAVGQAFSTNTLLPSYSYYNYSLTQQIYTAEEIGEARSIGNLAFFNTGYEKTRNYTIYMVPTNKTAFSSNTDWIVPTAEQQVFSGEVTLVNGGWTTITFDNAFDYDGTSNLALIVDDNSGNWTYNHMSCRVYNANGNQSIRIYSDNINYDAMNPSSYSGTRMTVKNQIILGVPSTMVESTSLSQGWNWWSTPIEQNGIDGLTMLENSLGQYGLTIKTQNEFVNNYSSYWYGSLETLENEKSYLIHTTAGCTATMTGVLATPEDHPITIVPNWNWNGYPVAVQQTVVNAFDGFTPAANDVVKHQSDFSTYYPTYGWWPEDFMMIPGRGYLYKSNATENKTLVYSSSVREAAEPQQEQSHYWSTDVHAYPNNLNVIAVVTVDGEEQRSDKLELGAFVNGECRGSARLRYFAPLDRYYAMLTVTGEAEEDVEFALVDTESEETMTNCDNMLTFTRDVVLGILDEPYEVRFNTTKAEPGRKAMALYPNPINRNQVFSLNIPSTETITEIIIVDMMGDIVRHETGTLNAQIVKGFPVTGVYVIKAIAKSGNIYHGRIIVD